MNYNLTNLKKEKEWLKEIDKFALQNSLKDLDRTYQNFFREVKMVIKIRDFLSLKANIIMNVVIELHGQIIILK